MEQNIIDPLTKERIFGLYAGQKIMTSDMLYNDGKDHYDKPVLSMAKYPGVFLKVKPLWRLTKEDALGAMRNFYRIFFLRADKKDPYPTESDIYINEVNEEPFDIKVRMCFEDQIFSMLIDTVVAKFRLDPEPYYEEKDLLDCYDFLRSKGYALPACGYGIHDLFDQNIFWWPEGRCTEDADGQRIGVTDSMVQNS